MRYDDNGRRDTDLIGHSRQRAKTMLHAVHFTGGRPAKLPRFAIGIVRINFARHHDMIGDRQIPITKRLGLNGDLHICLPASPKAPGSATIVRIAFRSVLEKSLAGKDYSFIAADTYPYCEKRGPMNDMNEIAANAADRTAVRITAVECISAERAVQGAVQNFDRRRPAVVETLIVKVHTDQGVTGAGETQAWRRQGSAETLEGQINVIKNHFEPQMIGRSPFDVNAIMHGLNESMYHSHYSQAAVGDALYDAVGKLLGVPVYQILGGKTRDRVRVAAVLSMKGMVESLLESADEFFEQGFRHLVLKIGVDPREDLRNAEALRKRFGDEIALRVDANAALDYDDALAC